MLVTQLTCGLFLLIMQAKNPSYTEEGLLLIWQEYAKDEKEMSNEDILVNFDGVASTFCEESLFEFVEHRLNCNRYFPADFRNMNDDEFNKVKEEVQGFLGGKFIGFTSLDRVVFKR